MGLHDGLVAVCAPVHFVPKFPRLAFQGGHFPLETAPVVGPAAGEGFGLYHFAGLTVPAGRKLSRREVSGANSQETRLAASDLSARIDW